MGIASFLPKGQYRYYYRLLSASEQRVYVKLLKGMVNFKPSVICPKCSAGEMQNVYESLRWDIPELFYVKNISLQYFSNAPENCTARLEYRFDEKTVFHILARLEQTYGDFIDSVKGKTELEREEAIHALLTSRVTYRDADAPYSHEAPGALLYGIGVCEGIAKAFQYLADRTGLSSILVIGEARNQEKEEGHAWNLCRVDGTFYHVDLTFDLTVSNGCERYDYFNLSDQEIRNDHRWSRPIPLCKEAMHYYKRKGLYFETKSQLVQFLRRLPEQTKEAVFQLPYFEQGREGTPELVKELIGEHLVRGAGENRRFSLSYHLERMVFEIAISSLDRED
ncbi:transglutaminase domain-containing protein [Hominifimenecus sp. rT4P-3]|uniref:transglutaminase domain-containing protein n=1 Tax=Hominifimenecus sp. rT4P-3 TaxID=3242979 RepID=UPI003DA4E860